jgi:hypothetical protein
MGLFGRMRIKRPLEGFAEIVECWPPPRTSAGGNCKMKLALDVPGVAPQVVKHHEAAMNANRWPEVGMRVAVTVDAKHPDRVDAHWVSVFGEMHGGPVVGRAAELLAGVVGIDADLSKGVAGESFGAPDEADAGKDPETLVADLNAAYARGEITYEQMADRLMRALDS